jgi:pimeloyl-ACP methyl ester carboxylesterase
MVMQIVEVTPEEFAKSAPSKFARAGRWMKLVVVSIGTGILLTALLAVYFQEYLWLPASIPGYVDYRLPPGFIEEKIETSDGEKLVLWRHEVDPAVKRGAVLILHGNGDLVPRTVRGQKFFNELGFATYEIDYRGTGKSSGTPKEAGLLLDAEAAWQYAVGREGGAANLHLYGRSFGTGPATYLAQRHDARSLVLISPYLSIPDVVSDRWEIFLLRPFLRINLPTRDVISRMKSTRILALHGDQDIEIQPHHSLELEKLYRGSGSFRAEIVAGAGHNDVVEMIDGPLRRWMDEVSPPIRAVSE